jgi:hypothetical protein
VINHIKITERGATPRGFKRAFGISSKSAWVSAGKLFHSEMRDDRFSVAHGRKAGYTPRQGEQAGTSGRLFWRSYTGRKLRKWHHRRPLEWSGETRRAVRSASITSTATRYTTAGSSGGGVRVAYAGARKFNFRNPHSNINMAEEFRRILPEEAERIARQYESVLDTELAKDSTTTTRQV